MNSLAGKKILVTRAANQSARLMQMLESGGATPLLFPCIEIGPLPIPDIDWSQYDSVVFTSHNGQKAFANTPIPPHIQVVTYADRLSPQGRVLLVQGNLADNSLRSTTRIIAYRTEIGSGGIDLNQHKLDAITFTSPSTAQNFLKRGGKQTDELIACIGTTTYNAVLELGFQNVVYAKEHNLEGLVQILYETFYELIPRLPHQSPSKTPPYA